MEVATVLKSLGYETGQFGIKSPWITVNNSPTDGAGFDGTVMIYTVSTQCPIPNGQLPAELDGQVSVSTNVRSFLDHDVA